MTSPEVWSCNLCKQVVKCTRDNFSSGFLHHLDDWTSRAGDRYFSVTAHFISKSWELVLVPLACAHFPNEHTAPRIREMVKAALERFGVEFVVIISVYGQRLQFCDCVQPR